ncbi:hypothetical protein [Amnibacterium endophyticum]|uniref:Uridine kinase n=1 Tax=Amnibacterium endophyticum TaxID=2109337 RepID=A0ABW4LKE6_9MICO
MRWQPDRSSTVAEYAREVLEVFPQGRLVLGIDGVETPWPGEHGEASGREAFARDLAGAFVDAGTAAAAVRLGDFLAADGLPADPERLYDVAAFRERVLKPYRRGDDLEIPSGDAESETTFSPGERAVLVVSGPFLHLGELPALWHRSAWLQIPRAEAWRREGLRTRYAEDSPELVGWSGLVDDAFVRVDARKRATATFDLTDPEHPRRRFEDAC